MALSIKWSKKADTRFAEIIEYLEKKWGTKTGGAFVKKVFEFLDLVSEFPEIGTIEKIDLQIRGFVIVKQITVFYQVRKEEIIILNFFDNRQNPKKKKF